MTQFLSASAIDQNIDMQNIECFFKQLLSLNTNSRFTQTFSLNDLFKLKLIKESLDNFNCLNILYNKHQYKNCIDDEKIIAHQYLMKIQEIQTALHNDLINLITRDIEQLRIFQCSSYPPGKKQFNIFFQLFTQKIMRFEQMIVLLSKGQTYETINTSELHDEGYFQQLNHRVQEEFSKFKNDFKEYEFLYLKTNNIERSLRKELIFHILYIKRDNNGYYIVFKQDSQQEQCINTFVHFLSLISTTELRKIGNAILDCVLNFNQSVFPTEICNSCNNLITITKNSLLNSIYQITNGIASCFISKTATNDDSKNLKLIGETQSEFNYLKEQIQKSEQPNDEQQIVFNSKFAYAPIYIEQKPTFFIQMPIAQYDKNYECLLIISKSLCQVLVQSLILAQKIKQSDLFLNVLQNSKERLVLKFDEHRCLTYINRQIPSYYKENYMKLRENIVLDKDGSYDFNYSTPSHLSDIFAQNASLAGKLKASFDQVQDMPDHSIINQFFNQIVYSVYAYVDCMNRVCEYLLIIEKEENAESKSAIQLQQQISTLSQKKNLDTNFSFMSMQLIQSQNKQEKMNEKFQKLLMLHNVNYKFTVQEAMQILRIKANQKQIIQGKDQEAMQDSIVSEYMNEGTNLSPEKSSRIRLKTILPSTYKRRDDKKLTFSMMIKTKQQQGQLIDNYDNDKDIQPIQTPAKQFDSIAMAIEPSSNYLKILSDWNLDVFSLEQSQKRNLVLEMFQIQGFISEYQIDQNIYKSFLSRLEMKYNKHNIPFHNFNHAFTVTHGIFYFLQNQIVIKSLSKLQQFALLFSALCHDVSHTGRTNAFEIAKFSPLALKCNDQSVLENHHIAVIFKMIQNDNLDILGNLPIDDFRAVRKLMISNILSTDMRKHFKMMKNIDSQIQKFENKNNLEQQLEEADQLVLSQFLIHAADLYSATKKFPLAEKWALLINQEFTNQVNEEEELCLPLTQHMINLDQPEVLAKNEISFITYIVKPLWVQVCKFTIGLHEPLANINENMEIWNRKLLECQFAKNQTIIEEEHNDDDKK